MLACFADVDHRRLLDCDKLIFSVSADGLVQVRQHESMRVLGSPVFAWLIGPSALSTFFLEHGVFSVVCSSADFATGFLRMPHGPSSAGFLHCLRILAPTFANTA